MNVFLNYRRFLLFIMIAVFILKVVAELSVINFGFDIGDEGLYLLSTQNSKINSFLPSHFQALFCYLPQSITGLRYVKIFTEISYIFMFYFTIII